VLWYLFDGLGIFSTFCLTFGSLLIPKVSKATPIVISRFLDFSLSTRLHQACSRPPLHFSLFVDFFPIEVPNGTRFLFFALHAQRRSQVRKEPALKH